MKRNKLSNRITFTDRINIAVDDTESKKTFVHVKQDGKKNEENLIFLGFTEDRIKAFLKAYYYGREYKITESSKLKLIIDPLLIDPDSVEPGC